jgi:hypothetical protein
MNAISVNQIEDRENRQFAIVALVTAINYPNQKVIGKPLAGGWSINIADRDESVNGWYELELCPTCHGSEDCPKCTGDGELIDGSKCKSCNGTGRCPDC